MEANEAYLWLTPSLGGSPSDGHCAAGRRVMSGSRRQRRRQRDGHRRGVVRRTRRVTQAARAAAESRPARPYSAFLLLILGTVGCTREPHAWMAINERDRVTDAVTRALQCTREKGVRRAFPLTLRLHRRTAAGVALRSFEPPVFLPRLFRRRNNNCRKSAHEKIVWETAYFFI
ncbi:hypothetical protein MRX96_023131 [Rhipicephalus microplus]